MDQSNFPSGEPQPEKAEGSMATELAEGSSEVKLATLLRSIKLWLHFEKASTLNCDDPITFELVRSKGLPQSRWFVF